MSDSQKINLLYKKFQQTAFTNVNAAPSAEAAGSSVLNIMAKNIWTLDIPNVAPFSITNANVENLTYNGQSTGKKYFVSDPSYIYYYDKVLLTTQFLNNGYAWRYYGTDATSGATILNTNILRGAIPSNYDPDNSYKVFVFNSSTGTNIPDNDAFYPWTFDGTAGYLTFFNPVPFIPCISFWRYVGPLGFPTNMSSNSGLTGLPSQGITGTQGFQGITGEKGETGAQGFQGVTGEKGETGAQGFQGVTGEKGLDGLTGPQGLQGITGEKGVTGPQGLPGQMTNLTVGYGPNKNLNDAIALYPNINNIIFDSGADFSVTNDSSTAFISLNSTFKYWEVNGNTAPGEFLTANGVDTVNFIGTSGISIQMDATTSPQSIIFGLTGLNNLQGITGEKGLDGLTGAQGFQGITGEKGLDGLTGAQGFQGITGEKGLDGLTGAQGLQGITGEKGLDGLTGAQGLQGITGEKGLDGLTGSQGLQGITGEKGLDGLTGAQGLQGITGEKGLDGLTGTQGLQGITGEKGETGAQGSQGFTGEKGLDGLTGAQGLQGITGEKGEIGAQGFQGFTGEKGLDGLTGAQGLQGITGEKGEIGAQGFQGFTGEKGLDGLTGAQGLQGITGEKGLTGFQGPQGFTGEKGYQGYQGVTGPRSGNTDINYYTFTFTYTINGTTLNPVPINSTRNITCDQFVSDILPNTMNATISNSNILNITCSSSLLQTNKSYLFPYSFSSIVPTFIDATFNTLNWNWGLVNTAPAGTITINAGTLSSLQIKCLPVNLGCSIANPKATTTVTGVFCYMTLGFLASICV